MNPHGLRFLGTASVAAFAFLFVAFHSFADDTATPPQAPSCARQSGLIGPCFTLRGRLSLYNGTPSARIWQVGSKRILGITESRCIEPECPQMPAELRKMLNWDEAIFGDFLVCPFTESKPGHMQFVCIESAENLTVRNPR